MAKIKDTKTKPTSTDPDVEFRLIRGAWVPFSKSANAPAVLLTTAECEAGAGNPDMPAVGATESEVTKPDA